MVIESRSTYKELLKDISDKDVYVVPIRDDFRTHPAESAPILLSISCQNKTYDIIFNHSESLSTDLDINDLSVVKRFWVEDVKQFYHLTKFFLGR